MELVPKTLNNISKLVKTNLQQHFQKVVSNYENVKVPEIKLQPAADKTSDYQSPSLNQIYNMNKKILSKDFKTIQDFSTKLISEFQADQTISKIEQGPNNFINIVLNDHFIESQISLLLQIGTVHPKQQNPSTIAVDFSSPNIAKEMHVGHLRSTIIGESICRILEYTNNNVLRINHLGDWGTQFGMLILHLQQTYPNFLENTPDLSDLTKFYKEAAERFKTDEEFKKNAQLTVVKLQSGDEECLKAWNVFCDVSRQFFNSIYKRLDITNNEYGESKYNPELPKIIKELEEKKLLEVDDGAKVVRIPKQKNPVIVQKRDGGYNYATTDLAAVKRRLFDLKCDRLIYITDGGQSYFYLIIGTKIDEDKYEEAAETMGIAAIKYFDLKQNRQSDYKFSYDKMLDTRGNTAVYLLYAYARINSIIRKSGWSEEELQNKKINTAWKITHPHERQIAVQLIRFTELVDDVSENLRTNIITDYIYDIASLISEGYKLYRILGEKETETRVLLCEAIRVILKQALYLIGIKPLDRI
ncbi:Aminoacyl-tRNA synthetase, class 1a, anticodon-binding [Pseudocohnilembus persalinus]|uniref:arginine--tRNA ligase n=1 Tax=Pseudocohnilembus persalinus TaxID=266149 RepID=A0A0V0R010_PSEPJ|nr:Aminoacyl-tRNA synthetase, class 1a, anticodon-binding [Pseudocohnilembus persalinus]|eukprot:KRX07860.1 Aminoacyl-tRNA synthetase, class 1a, anticodon-binding [Pseudocohnilembus persalinus]